MVFLDTNVIVHAASAKTAPPTKWARAVAVMQTEEYAVSAQVMVEFVNVARRRVLPPLAEEDIDAWHVRLRRRPTATVDADLVQRSARISRDHRINYYDGAIIAAAERLGCETLSSEDLNDGQLYGPVTVRNPFKDL